MVGAQSALGSPMTLAWLLVQFAVCALLIARSGYVLFAIYRAILRRERAQQARHERQRAQAVTGQTV